MFLFKVSFLKKAIMILERKSLRDNNSETEETNHSDTLKKQN